MASRIIAIFLFFQLVVATAFAADGAPDLILLSRKNLEGARAQLEQRTSALEPALVRLQEDAERAMTEGPFSVTDRRNAAPSGDVHDYVSLAPYWWPNPDRKGGRYVRRDGRVNPASESEDYDSVRIARMARAVETLSLAYYFTGNERFAARAALLLRRWFIEPETRMNPNLDYAQGIPGGPQGRGIGIIDSTRLIVVPDSVALVAQSEAWTEEDTRAMKRWFAEYTYWLLTSRLGADADRMPNNHGSWYDAQVATYAIFSGRERAATKVLKEARRRRIARQIEPDGSQRQELMRTRSFTYSAFNVRALFALARAGERVGVDLWGYVTKDRRSIRAALDYLVPYANPQKDWPHQQIDGPIRRQELLPLLLQAADAYRAASYRRAAVAHFAEEYESARARLMWNEVVTRKPRATRKPQTSP